MNVGNAYTYSVTVRPTITSTAPVLVAKAPRTGNGSSIHVPALYLTQALTVHDNFFISATNGASTPINQMTHISVTYDGVSRHRVYLNGTLSAERDNHAGGNEGANSEPAWVMTLGQSLNGFPGGRFAGQMRDFVFFQRELTPAEVDDLSVSGPVGL